MFANLTIDGYVTAEPEYVETSGKPYYKFTIANYQTDNGKKTTNYYYCKAWTPYIDRVMNIRMHEGDRVIVSGNLNIQWNNYKSYPQIAVISVDKIVDKDKCNATMVDPETGEINDNYLSYLQMKQKYTPEYVEPSVSVNKVEDEELDEEVFG